MHQIEELVKHFLEYLAQATLKGNLTVFSYDEAVMMDEGSAKKFSIINTIIVIL